MKTIRVTILGRPYPLRVEPADEEATERLAAWVDKRIRAMEASAPGHPALTHAVLAALSLADELEAARREVNALRHEFETTRASTSDARDVEAEAEALADRLDAALALPGAPGVSEEGEEGQREAADPERAEAVSSGAASAD